MTKLVFGGMGGSIYKGKLAENEPKIDKFQNLVITFD